MSKPIFRFKDDGRWVDVEIVKVLEKRGSGPLPTSFVIGRFPDGTEREVGGLWLPPLETLRTDAEGNVIE